MIKNIFRGPSEVDTYWMIMHIKRLENDLYLKGYDIDLLSINKLQ